MKVIDIDIFIYQTFNFLCNYKFNSNDDFGKNVIIKNLNVYLDNLNFYEKYIGNFIHFWTFFYLNTVGVFNYQYICFCEVKMIVEIDK